MSDSSPRPTSVEGAAADISVEYETTTADVMAFYMYRWRTSPTLRRSVRVQQLVAGLLGVLVLCMPHVPLTARVVGALAVIVAVIAMPPFLNAYQRRHYARMLREGSQRGVVGWHRVSITSNGDLNGESEIGYGFIIREAVERVVETPQHVFVFVTSMSAFVMPRATARGDLDGFIAALVVAGVPRSE